MKTTELKKELQQLKNQSPLHKHVINEIIRDSADYSGSFKEKLAARCEDIQHGCSSGIVSSLIYYSDTTAFYKKYKKDIQKLLKELCADCGCNVWDLLRDFDTDDIFCEELHNQNLLTWFGYEEINNQIYYLLEDI